MAPKKAAVSVEMARDPDEIRSNYFALTDVRQARVAIAPEARGVIRDFLESLDETLTVVEVKAALEGEWS